MPGTAPIAASTIWRWSCRCPARPDPAGTSQIADRHHGQQPDPANHQRRARHGQPLRQASAGQLEAERPAQRNWPRAGSRMRFSASPAGSPIPATTAGAAKNTKICAKMPSPSASQSAWRNSGPTSPLRPAPSSWATLGESAIMMPTMPMMATPQRLVPTATAPSTGAPRCPANTTSTTLPPITANWAAISGNASRSVARISRAKPPSARAWRASDVSESRPISAALPATWPGEARRAGTSPGSPPRAARPDRSPPAACAPHRPE